jgi:hypothetical protein
VTDPDPDPERTAGIAALAAILDALPARNDKVRPSALNPKMSWALAEQCWDRGVRVDAALATRFPIPGRQIPGAPRYMSLQQWVSRERYERYLRDNPQPPVSDNATHAAAIDQLRRMLEIVAPETAAKLPTLSDEERAAQHEAYAAKVPAAVQRLAKIAERNARLRGGAAK